MPIFAPLSPEAKARAIAEIAARSEAASLGLAPIPAPPLAQPAKRKRRKPSKPRRPTPSEHCRAVAKARAAYQVKAEREAANPEIKAARLARRRERDRARRLNQGCAFREAGTIEGRKLREDNPEIDRLKKKQRRDRYNLKNRERINRNRREKNAEKKR